MEQQTVTIAKAGIHASLNARSSVLAAANPIYGQYDKTRRPQENIGLPDSLLSRFDLLFIVLDQLDPTLDRTLSEHVIRSHQYRRAGTLMEPEPLNATTSLNLDENQDASVAVDTPMWQRGSRVFADSSGKKSAQTELLTKEFLRKYIHYAKQKLSPVLSTEAMETIASSYANMRARQSRKNLPVTARTLETIIRLSTAAAKARLSNSVDDCDVEVAMELMNFVLFHEIGSDSTTPVASEPQSLKNKLARAGENKENKENSPTQASVYDSTDSAEEVATAGRLWTVQVAHLHFRGRLLVDFLRPYYVCSVAHIGCDVQVDLSCGVLQGHGGPRAAHVVQSGRVQSEGGHGRQNGSCRDVVVHLLFVLCAQDEGAAQQHQAHQHIEWAQTEEEVHQRAAGVGGAPVAVRCLDGLLLRHQLRQLGGNLSEARSRVLVLVPAVPQQLAEGWRPAHLQSRAHSLDHNPVEVRLLAHVAEGDLPRRDLPNENAEGVCVHGLVVGAPQHHLRSHVAQRSRVAGQLVLLGALSLCAH